MKLDKKLVTIFVLVTFVAAGTALASLRTTTTTQSITVGNGDDAVTASSTTTTTTYDRDHGPYNSATIVTTSPDAQLANLIFRVLGIPVSIQEVTVLKSRNMGYGDIALAYNLASASGRPVNEIIAMRYDYKMGWGKIAKTLGVKLHSAADNSVLILREAKLDQDADNFQLSIKVDLDDDDRDEVKKSEHDKPTHFSKDDDDNDRDKDHDKDHGKGNSKRK